MSAIVTPAGAVLMWGALAAASGRYLYPGGLNNATASTGESVTWFRLPRAGVLRNLWAEAGANTTVTIRINGTNTGLSLSLVTNTLNSDLVHQVAVAAGDYISVVVGGTAGADCRVYCEFV